MTIFGEAMVGKAIDEGRVVEVAAQDPRFPKRKRGLFLFAARQAFLSRN
jgi:hypothetical protein